MSCSGFLVLSGASIDTRPISFPGVHRRQLARDTHGRGRSGKPRQAEESKKENLEGEASKVLYHPSLCAVVDLLEER